MVSSLAGWLTARHRLAGCWNRRDRPEPDHTCEAENDARVPPPSGPSSPRGRSGQLKADIQAVFVGFVGDRARRHASPSLPASASRGITDAGRRMTSAACKGGEAADFIILRRGTRAALRCHSRLRAASRHLSAYAHAGRQPRPGGSPLMVPAGTGERSAAGRSDRRGAGRVRLAQQEGASVGVARSRVPELRYVLVPETEQVELLGAMEGSRDRTIPERKCSARLGRRLLLGAYRD